MKYQGTMNACFTGYIVQAIANNFVPLLFVTFQSSWHIPLSRITLLITVNFVIQLTVDLASAGFVDRTGYRAAAVAAHVLAAAGLVMLTFLPDVMQDPFYGLLLSVGIYAVGGIVCSKSSIGNIGYVGMVFAIPALVVCAAGLKRSKHGKTLE